MLKGMLKIIGTICLAGILLYVYTTKIEPKLLKVTEHQLPVDKGNTSLQNIKIVQFTDTHLGAFFDEEEMEKVVNKINSLKPDIVVFTGDLVDHWGEYQGEGRLGELLKEIEAPIGKFAVYGNHDYGGSGYKIYKSFMENHGFNVLVNEVYTISLADGKQINIAGLDDVLLGKPNIKKVVKNLDEKDYNILLVHEPDIVDQLPKDIIDIQLSGHSHGGQVKIPGLVEKIVPPYAQKYIDGMHEISERTRLYVNTGIGSTKVPFRLGNIPEISLFTFK